MRILLKILTGIVCSIIFLIVSAMVGVLVGYGLAKLLTTNPSSVNTLTAFISRIMLIAGAVTGFYIGYSRTLKKDEQKIDNRRLFRRLIVLVIFLFLSGIIGYTIFVNMRAYNKYAYYVHVSDEDVFISKIDPEDEEILDHGRMEKNKVFTMDHEIDIGDGPNKGKLRWYECYGIDCDEGWENRFSD